MERSRFVLILSVLCLVSTKVHCEKIDFPEDVSRSETLAEVSDVDEMQPESRGFWESDLFFLQKLSGLFGGSDKEDRGKPSRDGSLRPEPLPLQLAYPPNRRVGQGNQKPPPQRRAPIFRLSTPHPGIPHQDLNSPPNFVQQPPHNSLVQLPPPPPTPPSLPPPPAPPSSKIPGGVPLKPGNNFPYQFVLPNVLTPPAVNTPQHTPVHASHKVDIPPQTPKPNAIKHKNPTAFESSHDLHGSFTVTQEPQLLLPSRPRPQHPQQQLFLRPRPEQQQLPFSGSVPHVSLPHPRPAPQPQKQHPRPPPQPQRVVIQPEKPTTIRKKPIDPNFNPSPQEGSMLADAFQPVFVASPSMDDLDNLDNDLMKPMTLISARSAVTSSTVANDPPKLEDFF